MARDFFAEDFGQGGTATQNAPIDYFAQDFGGQSPSTTQGENQPNIQIPGPRDQSLSTQFGRGAQDVVQSIPHGTQIENLVSKTSPLINLMRLIPQIRQMGQQYSQDVQNAPPAEGILPNVARFGGNVGAYSLAAAPLIAGAEALPAIPAVTGVASKLPGLARLVQSANSPLGRTAIGVGGFEATKKVGEGKPLEAPGAFATGAGTTYVGGKILSKATKGLYEAPGAIKNYFSDPARIARYGKRLKIAEPMIKGIQKYGVEPLLKFTESLGNTTKEAADAISQKVGAAFEAKSSEAENAFKQAMSNIPIGYKDRIDVSSVRNKLIQIVRKYGKLASSDAQGKKLVDLLRSLNEMTSAGKGALTKAQRAQISITGKSQKELAREVLINKDMFHKFRDILNNLYKESFGDRDIYSLVDTLYKAGEKSGLKGLTKARALFRQLKMAERLYPKSLFSEAKLTKVAGNLPKEDLRKLKSLEKYLGIKFVEDAEKVSLSEHAKKIADAMKNKSDAIKKGIGLFALEEIASRGGVTRKAIKLTGLGD